eukprot:COSAG02_NODE_3581_length_6531_cov_11.484764_2_plen_1709_part_00
MGKYIDVTGSDDVSDCIDCVAGKYIDVVGSDEAGDCIDCVVGKYSDVTGSDDASDCIDCVAGKYIDVAGSDEAGDCIDCVAGKYIDVVGSDEAGDCIDCVAGTYADTVGNDDASDCIVCVAGKYVTTSGSDESGDCIDCVVGKYIDVAGSDEAGDCIDCVAGTYADTVGNDDVSDCIDCVAGKYVTTSGSDEAGDCIDCVAGKYIDVVGSDEAGDCIDCVVGKYIDVTGSDDVSDCIDCVAGKYIDVVGSDEAGDCIDCVVGKYNDVTGSDDASDCIDCVAGKYIDVAGSDEAGDCIDCVAGKYIDVVGSDEAGDCIDCVAGTYADTVGNDDASDCIVCVAGKYVTTSGSDEAGDCIDCVVGKYIDVAGSDEAGDCIDCVVGKYIDVTGSDDCIDCVAGKYIDVVGNDEAGDCIDCVAGKYIDVAGSDEAGDCIDCVVGKYIDVTGSDDVSDCIDCVAGKYIDVAGSDEAGDCIDCVVGKYNDVTGSDDASDCIDCVAGKYIDVAGSGESGDCIDCVAGKYIDVVGSDEAGDCIDCVAGKYVPTSGSDESGDCIDCVVGKYIDVVGSDEAGDCIDCVAGRYIDVTSSDEAGDCIDCVVGKYINVTGSDEAGDCIACPAGKYIDIDAAIDCIDCVAGTYVDVPGSEAAANCTRCAVGRYSQTSGSATRSDCQLCAAGRFSPVLGSSGCIVCPIGTYSEQIGSFSSAACLKSNPIRMVIATEPESWDSVHRLVLQEFQRFNQDAAVLLTEAKFTLLGSPWTCRSLGFEDDAECLTKHVCGNSECHLHVVSESSGSGGRRQLQSSDEFSLVVGDGSDQISPDDFISAMKNISAATDDDPVVNEIVTVVYPSRTSQSVDDEIVDQHLDRLREYEHIKNITKKACKITSFGRGQPELAVQLVHTDHVVKLVLDATFGPNYPAGKEWRATWEVSDACAYPSAATCPAGNSISTAQLSLQTPSLEIPGTRENLQGGPDQMDLKIVNVRYAGKDGEEHGFDLLSFVGDNPWLRSSQSSSQDRLKFRFSMTAVHVEADGATCTAAADSVELLFNTPPKNGRFSMSPESGSALSTPFTLEAEQWADGDTPLRYAFFRQNNIPISSLSTSLIKEIPYLAEDDYPPGSFGVRVVDDYGAESIEHSTDAISVGPSQHDSASSLKGAADETFGTAPSVDDVFELHGMLAAFSATLSSAISTTDNEDAAATREVLMNSLADSSRGNTTEWSPEELSSTIAAVHEISSSAHQLSNDSTATGIHLLSELAERIGPPDVDLVAKTAANLLNGSASVLKSTTSLNETDLNLTDASQRNAQTQAEMLTSLLERLTQLAAEAMIPGEIVSIETDLFVMDVYALDPSDPDNTTLSLAAGGSTVDIPGAAFNGSTTIQVIDWVDEGPFFWANNTLAGVDATLGTNVLTVSLFDEAGKTNVSGLDPPAKLEMPLTIGPNDTKAYCSFWDIGKDEWKNDVEGTIRLGNWSFNTTVVAPENGTESPVEVRAPATVTCEYTHFTDFAALVGPKVTFNDMSVDFRDFYDLNPVGFFTTLFMLAFTLITCCYGVRDYNDLSRQVSGFGTEREEFDMAAAAFARQMQRVEDDDIPWLNRSVINLRTGWLWGSMWCPLRGDPFLRSQKNFIFIMQTLVSMALSVLFYAEDPQPCTETCIDGNCTIVCPPEELPNGLLASLLTSAFAIPVVGFLNFGVRHRCLLQPLALRLSPTAIPLTL